MAINLFRGGNLKKLFLFFLGLVFLSTLALVTPSVIGAKEKNPQVFITYTDKNAKVGICQATTNDQVNTFATTGWRLSPGISDYKLKYSSKPRSWTNGAFQSAIDLAFSNIQGAGGGVLFHYAGESREGRPANDNQNTIMWQVLPAGVVAMTYIWTQDGHLTDADTVINNRYLFSLTDYTGSNDCGGSRAYFDLRNIATHEFGHWVGLGDLYDSRAKDLTMYGFAVRGELKKDTLGLGDITGVRALWP